MNYTSYIAANPTKFKLSKPQMNLLAKLDAMNAVVSENQSITNPTNGLTRDVDPFIASLVRWVYTVHISYQRTGKLDFVGTKVAIGTFDRVRYLILDLDKQTFRDFID